MALKSSCDSVRGTGCTNNSKKDAFVHAAIETKWATVNGSKRSMLPSRTTGRTSSTRKDYIASECAVGTSLSLNSSRIDERLASLHRLPDPLLRGQERNR